MSSDCPRCLIRNMDRKDKLLDREIFLLKASPDLYSYWEGRLIYALAMSEMSRSEVYLSRTGPELDGTGS